MSVTAPPQACTGTAPRAAAPLVVIFAESAGWHEARLSDALVARGARVQRIALTDCRLGAASGETVHLPGLDRHLPDAALVRAIPGGTFQQVTFRLAVLHALADCGTALYNDARAIERTVDKGLASALLGRAGVPTPPTWVLERRSEALALLRREHAAGHRLVLKPLFGNQGRGLVRVGHPWDLPDEAAVEGVYYLQRYLPRPGALARDWRVLVIDGEAVAAMERVSRHWVTNRAQGGRCRPAVADSAMAELAVAATDAVGARYAGVDIARDDRGRPVVLEVNGIPAWHGLQSVNAVDIAARLADAALRAARHSARRGAPRVTGDR